MTIDCRSNPAKVWNALQHFRPVPDAGDMPHLTLDDAETLAAALAYAAIGLRPIPFAPRGKRPWDGLTRWPSRASSDRKKVARMFAGKARANVGLALGQGVFALDIDEAKGGLDSVVQLVNCRTLPSTAIACTGGGGLHYLYRVAAGVRIRNPTDFLPGLDIRGDGGAIAVWPSIHPNGRRYVWERHPSEGISDAPNWLVDELTSRRPKNVPLAKVQTDASPRSRVAPALNKDGDADDLFSEAIDRFTVTARGQRNGQMIRLIGSLLRRRFKIDLIITVVERWWVHFHQAGLIRTHPAVAKAVVYLNTTCMYESPGFRWGWTAADHITSCLSIMADPLPAPSSLIPVVESQDAGEITGETQPGREDGLKH